MPSQILAYAPVVLFVHTRVDHTKETIASLKRNSQYVDTDIIVYSDEGRDEKEKAKVETLRKMLSQEIVGSKSINIIKRNTNFGLAKNIINGVTEVINRYGKVIVLEDDIVVDPNFLTYMNKNLQDYEYLREIWHISGWSPHSNTDNNSLDFFSYNMNCWGWATWKNRWDKCEFLADSIIREFSYLDRFRFNIYGKYPFFSHLVGNYLGVNRTWAIFWYACIFLNGGRCVNPINSLVVNIGHDGSGSHTPIQLDSSKSDFNVISLNCNDSMSNENVKNNTIEMASFYTLSLFARFKMWVKMLLPVSVLKMIRALL